MATLGVSRTWPSSIHSCCFVFPLRSCSSNPPTRIQEPDALGSHRAISQSKLQRGNVALTLSLFNHSLVRSVSNSGLVTSFPVGYICILHAQILMKHLDNLVQLGEMFLFLHLIAYVKKMYMNISEDLHTFVL